MDLLLTSFGISHSGRGASQSNKYYRMPPLMGCAATLALRPDYSLLLLCDRVIVDVITVERLRGEAGQAYKEMAETVRVLHSEGFVRIEDFDSIVRAKQSFLNAVLERDLQQLETWVHPLKQSASIWHGLIRDFFGSRRTEGEAEQAPMPAASYFHDANNWSGITMSTAEMASQALTSSRKRRLSEFREPLRSILEGYLAYVNINLVLSDHFKCGFHDWEDFEPFYRSKFLGVAIENRPIRAESQTIRSLFDVSFPELRVSDVRHLVRILKDPRIVELRKLVQAALREEVEFDLEFAVEVLREVFSLEQKARKMRKILSYGTFPLDLIPWVGTIVQKAAEEGIAHAIEKKQCAGLQWFYLISEAAETHRPQTN